MFYHSNDSLPGRTLKELFLSTRDVLLTNPSRGNTGARSLMRAWRHGAPGSRTWFGVTHSQGPERPRG